MKEVEAISRRALAAGFQVSTHAIGDAANHDVLEAYARAGVTPAARFRIEHAQILDPADIPRFSQLGVIASIQPTHATSDMPWAEKRSASGGSPAPMPGAPCGTPEFTWRSGATSPSSSATPGSGSSPR